MTKLGLVLGELTKFAEGGYALTLDEKEKLVVLAKTMDPPSRNILLSGLLDLGLMLKPEIDRILTYAGEGVTSWVNTADKCITEREISGTDLILLEKFFDIEDPIEQYPVPFDDDKTIAGLLYKLDRKYDSLLRYFSANIIAKIYLSHYKGWILESVRVFYELATNENCRSDRTAILLEISKGICRYDNYSFVKRIRNYSSEVLGKRRSEELGGIILSELLTPDRMAMDEYIIDFLLHLVYFLGVKKDYAKMIFRETPELSRAYASNYEIFRMIYAKYGGLVNSETIIQELSDRRPYWRYYSEVMHKEDLRILYEYKSLEWMELANRCSITGEVTYEEAKSLSSDFYIGYGYPFELKDDKTIAGCLYKGIGKYDNLLGSFTPNGLMDIYQSHFAKHPVKSIQVFYHLVTSGYLSSRRIPEFIFNLGMYYDSDLRSEFIRRIRTSARRALGRDKSEELGGVIFSFLINRYGFSEYNDNVDFWLHAIYFLGMQPVKANELICSHKKKSNKLLEIYDIFKIIYMEYYDDILCEELEQRSRISTPIETEFMGVKEKNLLEKYYEWLRSVNNV